MERYSRACARARVRQLYRAERSSVPRSHLSFDFRRLAGTQQRTPAFLEPQTRRLTKLTGRLGSGIERVRKLSLWRRAQLPLDSLFGVECQALAARDLIAARMLSPTRRNHSVAASGSGPGARDSDMAPRPCGLAAARGTREGQCVARRSCFAGRATRR